MSSLLHGVPFHLVTLYLTYITWYVHSVHRDSSGVLTLHWYEAMLCSANLRNSPLTCRLMRTLFCSKAKTQTAERAGLASRVELGTSRNTVTTARQGWVTSLLAGPAHEADGSLPRRSTEFGGTLLCHAAAEDSRHPRFCPIAWEARL